MILAMNVLETLFLIGQEFEISCENFNNIVNLSRKTPKRTNMEYLVL